MKFTAEKSKLLRAASLAAAAVENKTTLPVLTCLLLRANGNISFTGSNLEIFASGNCDGKIAGGGDICVPPRKFIDFVKDAPGEITLATEPKGRISLASGKSKAVIACLDAAEFPALKATEGVGFELAESVLKDRLGTIRVAMSDDPTRHLLCSVLFQFDHNTLMLVATDGRRLNMETLSVNGTGSYIVPSAVINRLYSILSTSEAPVNCLFRDNSCAFIGSDWRLEGKLVDGSYPNRKDCIPSGEKHIVTLDFDELRSVISRARSFTTEQRIAVRLSFTRDTLTVSSGDSENTFEDSIPVCSATELATAVNPTYFLESLTGVKSNGKLELIDELSPIVVTDGGFQSIIMPIRVA